MIPVFICEDNIIQLKEIEELVKKHILIEAYDSKIVIATSQAEEIIEYLKHNSVEKGIYFLDIDLQFKLNGFELASLIRKKDPHGNIVFITDHKELSEETYAYKIEALEFIAKGNLENLKKRVRECLDYVIMNYEENKNYNKEIFKIKEMDTMRFIPTEDIMFIETMPASHKLRIHTSSRQIEFNGDLSKLEKNYSFLKRCHQSVLVNEKNIDHINLKERTITMKNGEETIASARLMKSLL